MKGAPFPQVSLSYLLGIKHQNEFIMLKEDLKVNLKLEPLFFYLNSYLSISGERFQIPIRLYHVKKNGIMKSEIY